MKNICNGCTKHIDCIVGLGGRGTDKCDRFQPRTNFDKISSSPEKLATHIASGLFRVIENCSKQFKIEKSCSIANYDQIYNRALSWLNQEIEILSEPELPKMNCPQCGKEYDDGDGFGVLYCPECGYCIHASVTDGKCDYCGKEEK